MSTPISTQELKEAFKKLSVLIIGDVMIDAYVWGTSTRSSPEAPIPIVDVEKKEKRLGGAANVALNIKSLGAKPIICSVIGEDQGGTDFLNLLTAQQLSSDCIIRSTERKTTIKNRVFSYDKQVLRIDEESKMPLNKNEYLSLISEITALLHQIDLIIFEDYNKGTITPELIAHVVKKAKVFDLPVVVDPKKENFLAYKEVSLFKPNLKEIQEGLNIGTTASLESLHLAAKALQKELNHSATLITLAEHGMYIHADDMGDEGELLPAFTRKVVDVSGAGDTVIATAALCLAVGLSHHSMSMISNLAGGLVCEQLGVKPIALETLLQEIETHEISLTVAVS